jgi:hypothetical protein
VRCLLGWAAASALFLILAACASPPAPASPRTATLATAESLYADLRAMRDRIDVSIASGRTGVTGATPMGVLIRGYNGSRTELRAHLAAIDSAALGKEDRRALGVMRRTLARDLDSLSAPLPPEAKKPEEQPDCGYEPSAIAEARNGLDSLRKGLYACYGWAQSHVVYLLASRSRVLTLASPVI